MCKKRVPARRPVGRSRSRSLQCRMPRTSTGTSSDVTLYLDAQLRNGKIINTEKLSFIFSAFKIIFQCFYHEILMFLRSLVHLSSFVVLFTTKLYASSMALSQWRRETHSPLPSLFLSSGQADSINSFSESLNSPFSFSRIDVAYEEA